MLSFINNFGQRRFAKWITILSFVMGLITFLVKYGIQYFETFHPYFGLFLLTAPHYFLHLGAEISREFRLPSVFASLLIVVVNFVLFVLDVSEFLFFVTLAECFITFVFYIGLLVQKKTTNVSNKTK